MSSRAAAVIPLQHAARAAALLEALPLEARPDWTPVWAHRVISLGGPGVEQAWELLRAVRS